MSIMMTVACAAVCVLRRNDLLNALKDEDALEIELHVLLEAWRLSGRVDAIRNAIGSSLLQLLSIGLPIDVGW
jgi:hypothetical protein